MPALLSFALMEVVLTWLKTNPEFAWLISLAINLAIALLGFIPSAFLTAANIALWGFWYGTGISLLGEVLGAVVSFYVYRLGWKRIQPATDTWPLPLQNLITLEGWPAAKLILALRIMPFMPSGLVTLAGAMSRVNATHFILSSSLGKIPALLIEALAVTALFELPGWAKLLAFLVMLVVIYRWLSKKPYESRK
jgi:uncharacterized membrane protein YdjX (TVP38/TMEM64 family)